MRLLRARVHGIGPLRDVDLDFRSLANGRPRLVVLVGNNGVGKSTLLEAILPGALYRRTPTRGSLSDLARRGGIKDAYVEIEAEITDVYYRIEHKLDGNSTDAPGKAYVYGADGQPVDGARTGNVRDFDRWSAATSPARRVLYSTVYGAQARARRADAVGFSGLPRSARKAAILRARGVERIEALAKGAVEWGKTERAEVERVQGDVDRLRPEARVGEPLDEQVATARSAVDMAASDVARARTALDAAVQGDQAATLTRTTVAEQGAKRQAYERQAAAARGMREAAERRRADLSTLQGSAAEIRAAVARGAERSQRITETERALAERGVMLAAATERARVAEADAGRARDAGADASRRRAVAVPRAAERAEVETAQAALPGFVAVLAERTAERQRLEAEADLYQRQVLRGAYLRIDTLRAVLTAIVAGTRGRKASAEEALRLDDQHAALCAAAPASLAVMAEKVSTARTAEQAAHVQVDATERTIARLDLVRAAEQAVVDADGAQRDAAEREARAQDDGARAEADAQANQAEHSRLAAALAALRTQDTADALLRSRAADLDRLADEEAALADQIARADREEATALALLGALPTLDAPTAPVDPTALPRACAALQAAEQAHRRAVVDLATLEERVNVAHAARTKLGLAEAVLRPLVTRAQNLALLANALGPDGIQVDEIANAGPELSAVANDLLHRGYGARYTLMFDTTAKGDPGEDGDGCEVRVYDAVADAWATVEEMSGGQEVLIELAASLSIGALACHSAWIRRPTLARDEADAHLRPEHARAYARILMLGAELMEADVVLVVSHRDEVLAHADAVIHVADGTARLMSVDAWQGLTAQP